MSVTYPADPLKPYGERIETPGADLRHEEPFVPVYARRGKARSARGKIRTWMILAPVGAIALVGIGAAMMMNGGEPASAPLAEPARTGPVLSATPIEPATAPLTAASTPAPVIAPAPVVREAAPARRAAATPVRREAVRAPATAPAATPRVTTPAPTGPQSYTPAPSAPSTASLNTASPAPAPVISAPAATTPAPTPPPVIVVEPVG